MTASSGHKYYEIKKNPIFQLFNFLSFKNEEIAVFTEN